jgi:hypothetical protein
LTRFGLHMYSRPAIVLVDVYLLELCVLRFVVCMYVCGCVHTYRHTHCSTLSLIVERAVTRGMAQAQALAQARRNKQV